MPWQCIKDLVGYFLTVREKLSNSYFLVLLFFAVTKIYNYSKFVVAQPGGPLGIVVFY